METETSFAPNVRNGAVKTDELEGIFHLTYRWGKDVYLVYLAYLEGMELSFN